MGSAQTNINNQEFKLGFIDCFVIKIEWKVYLAKRLVYLFIYKDWFIYLFIRIGLLIYRLNLWFIGLNVGSINKIVFSHAKHRVQ